MIKMRVMTMAMLFIPLLLSGCGKPTQGNNSETGLVPPEVAGRWVSKEIGWEIEIGKDGRILSAVVTPGEVKVLPNTTTRVEMQDGSFSTYTSGDFILDYEPISRILSVDITMKSIHVKFLDNSIDGNNRNVFSGPVSRDGQKWDTTWMEVFDYGPRFPMDPNAVGEGAIFEKAN